MKSQLTDKSKQLDEAQKQELELRKRQRELEDRGRNLKLEVQRTLDAERAKIWEDAFVYRPVLIIYSVLEKVN